LADTEVGRIALATAEQITGSQIKSDLGRPQVVVLACDSMTPGIGVQQHDGPARTLHERFLWRLFDSDYTLYGRYATRLDKAGIGEALAAVNRPVLGPVFNRRGGVA
jgi:hypothetical protein